MRYLLILFLMTITSTACSGPSEDKWTKQRPQTFPASGTVTFKGAPLEGATVIFRSNSGEPQAAVGRTDQEGKFQLRTFEDGDGAIAGEHSVAITCVKTEGPPEGANLDEANVVIKETSLIPQQYGDPKKSGLTATVVPDQENQFTFELKEKK
ncbi:carboxypeptidase regulatory-like domain-containing protein [Gimesia fumaroli]|uniref:Nickel uptake substrate-specific transmembrane region n=1 Tax=Gimesia fumaroli TaxID=2527976 RepID=A0A518I8K0_9PLAN|nr:carboxypeptidase regulatory-like domain-containing protein [Gimesia fumaroli]QDV49426.1 hypothetical protein Enr17x_14430 [Gimesia fumaroli]